jgi:hypothetical protein
VVPFKTIESFGTTHKTIPPGAHRFQSDVESVHSIMENEFYIEKFNSKNDFLQKAQDYLIFFNYVRKNSGKESKCPFGFLKEKIPSASFNLLYMPASTLNELHLEIYPKIPYSEYHVGLHT